MGVAREAKTLDLWPEHWALWEVWMALQNAWNIVAGISGQFYLGFDRSQAESVMRLNGVKKSDRRQMLRDLLTLEAAALPILNSR